MTTDPPTPTKQPMRKEIKKTDERVAGGGDVNVSEVITFLH